MVVDRLKIWKTDTFCVVSDRNKSFEDAKSELRFYLYMCFWLLRSMQFPVENANPTLNMIGAKYIYSCRSEMLQIWPAALSAKPPKSGPFVQNLREVCERGCSCLPHMQDQQTSTLAFHTHTQKTRAGPLSCWWQDMRGRVLFSSGARIAKRARGKEREQTGLHHEQPSLETRSWVSLHFGKVFKWSKPDHLRPRVRSQDTQSLTSELGHDTVSGKRIQAPVEKIILLFLCGVSMKPCQQPWLVPFLNTHDLGILIPVQHQWVFDCPFLPTHCMGHAARGCLSNEWKTAETSYLCAAPPRTKYSILKLGVPSPACCWTRLKVRNEVRSQKVLIPCPVGIDDKTIGLTEKNTRGSNQMEQSIRQHDPSSRNWSPEPWLLEE